MSVIGKLIEKGWVEVEGWPELTRKQIKVDRKVEMTVRNLLKGLGVKGEIQCVIKGDKVIGVDIRKEDYERWIKPLVNCKAKQLPPIATLTSQTWRDLYWAKLGQERGRPFTKEEKEEHIWSQVALNRELSLNYIHDTQRN